MNNMNNFITCSEELRNVLPLGEDLHRYVKEGHGYILGSFLTAVIENDFIAAVNHADHINLELLSAYVIYMAKFAPPASIGKNNVKDWKGLDNYE